LKRCKKIRSTKKRRAAWGTERKERIVVPTFDTHLILFFLEESFSEKGVSCLPFETLEIPQQHCKKIIRTTTNTLQEVNTIWIQNLYYTFVV